MFPFDQSALPSLPKRKALLVIDFQSDFLDPGGPLPVDEPKGFVGKTVEFAAAFRKLGDVIWVCSEFDKARPIAGGQILASDDTPKPSSLTAAADRRRGPKAVHIPPPEPDADPEAFLSPGGAPCVRSPSGSQIPTRVKDAAAERDVTFIKSHYSAFKSGQLLHLLRGKFITHLFIAGSLINIGVFATAVDAAMYGYDITLIEDCCGYRSDLRQGNAIQSVIDVTGCEVDSSATVLGQLQPKPPAEKPPAKPPGPSSAASATRKVGGLGGARTPPAPGRVRGKDSGSDLHEKLAALKLGGAGLSQVEPDPDSDGLALEVDPDAQPSSHDPSSPSHIPSSAGGSQSPALDLESIRKKYRKTGETRTDRPQAKKVKQPRLVEQTPTRSKPDAIVNTQIAATLEPDTIEPDTTAVAATPSEPSPKDDASSPDVSEPLCEGDTVVIRNVLPPKLVESVFDRLRDEVCWQTMSHQGGEVPRKVAVQGLVADDGSMPVYRHPADESPPLLAFSKTVLEIKAVVEERLKHPLNHVLIQFYRDGNDYISEHSDKTLDIVKGSSIVNVSLGAERTMVFRTKRLEKDPSKTEQTPDDRKRTTTRKGLPHNSMCRMGLATNMRWLHAIRQDKRAERDKSSAELAFAGARISLTFRHIGTFLNRDSTLIWGQGATAKTKADARPVLNGQGPEAVGMLRAFGTENHSSDFDWAKHYGAGFDVLHMSSSSRLFFSSDAVVNMRVQLMLAEHNIAFAKGRMSPSFDWKEGKTDTAAAATAPPALESLSIKYVDNDVDKSTVQGDMAIMLYLDNMHGRRGSAGPGPARPGAARIFTRFQQGLALLDKWRGARAGCDGAGKHAVKFLKRELATWEGYASEAEHIAGPGVSVADFACWPVLHEMVQTLGIEALEGTKALQRYYLAFAKRDAVAKVVLAAGPPAGEAPPEQKEGDDGEVAASLADAVAKMVLADGTPAGEAPPKQKRGDDGEPIAPSADAVVSGGERGQKLD